MDSQFEIYDLYDQMERKNIMLSFKGELNTELLGSILKVVEDKMARFDEKPTIRKRVFNVLVELLQNLYHHRGYSAVHNGESQTEQTAVIIMIAKNITGYSIITGNFVDNENMNKLRARLEEINGMSKQDLKELYKAVLSDGVMSEKGGGGLGMIDIARKADQKIEYGFIPFDENNSFFSLNVQVA